MRDGQAASRNILSRTMIQLLSQRLEISFVRYGGHSIILFVTIKMRSSRDKLLFIDEQVFEYF